MELQSTTSNNSFCLIKKVLELLSFIKYNCKEILL